MESKPLYFACGSNLNETYLKEWCRKHGRAYPLGEKMANAYLPDARLVFNYFSPDHGGMLNIKYHAGHVVPGVLFNVVQGGWDVLDTRAKYEHQYKDIDIITLTEDGREHLAVAYQVAGMDTSGNFVKPYPGYIDIIREGFVMHGIDDALLKPISEGIIPPQMVDRLFVYGSLMSDGPRHYLFAEWADRFSKTSAVVSGSLYDSGAGFPCMIPDSTGRHAVSGELFILRDYKKSFERLDFMEMSDPVMRERFYFRRAIVRATTSEGETFLAWTYVTDSSVEGMALIPSGDWRDVGK
ncbi:MAG: hypothetical protein CSYNP_00187 [Syntrophus sp. SKADARSKE-3]|nr:hypothetical protein [Syntrophus sp. SKADARSKE-3]